MKLELTEGDSLKGSALTPMYIILVFSLSASKSSSESFLNRDWSNVPNSIRFCKIMKIGHLIFFLLVSSTKMGLIITQKYVNDHRYKRFLKGKYSEIKHLLVNMHTTIFNQYLEALIQIRNLFFSYIWKTIILK